MADDKELEAFFAAARADVAVPDAALLDRIAAEGRALQPAPRPQVGSGPAPGHARRGGGGFRGLLGGIGGWPVLGGLVTAGLAGLWLGLSDTGGVSGYVYGAASDGWLYGPADVVALAVTEEGI
ncbi:hypothetical protein [Albidovulum sp.]|uniref:hypothetical protein n=1 Tax=Albidovulum sp. TaxID=1872424 RepID=UPI001D861FA5|nr:hypothetical protein [Paracoccaceae bacterium]MCC0046053.1 hypothetical protein [Defluviimonas sp.]HPE24428.1 hypothetical protein [Albidovulum sp.]MCB2120270.1 hypothetical protein [Paracoccaceae bacterium]MCB2121504.1 hypothetical protein [Paracoccaceae bacterium]